MEIRTWFRDSPRRVREASEGRRERHVRFAKPPGMNNDPNTDASLSCDRAQAGVTHFL